MFDDTTSISLPSKCEIVFDYKTTGASSSYEHRLFFLSRNLYNGTSQPTYALFVGNTSCGTGQCGYRTNGSTSNNNYSNTITCDEYHNIKITRDGTSIAWYIDDMTTPVRTATISWIGNYSDYWFDFHLWNSGTVKVKDIKIKSL